MTPKQLAAAIRKGHGMAGEACEFMTTLTHAISYPKSDCCCALGAAWLGSGKSERDYWDGDGLGIAKIARGLRIPEELASEISSRHCSGTPRLAIADWLDTLEPETKPADKQSFDAFMATVMKPVPVTA